MDIRLFDMITSLDENLNTTGQKRYAKVTHEQLFITKFAYAHTLSSCSKKKTAVLITALYSRDY